MVTISRLFLNRKLCMKLTSKHAKIYLCELGEMLSVKGLKTEI